jgi:hypothetical protein
MRRWCLLATLACSLGLAGCSSSQSVESDEPAPQRPTNKQYEVTPYLVDDDADAIVKFRAADWPRLQPLVAGLLAAEERDGGEANSLVRAAEAGPVRFAGRLSGQDLDLEHLADERPGYLVFQPHAHSAQQSCLTAGFPCVLFASPGPRFGRLILPSDAPQKLADELDNSLEGVAYRITQQRHHVRLEFSTHSQPAEQIDESLRRRINDRPEDDFYGRRTPARQALLDRNRPFGVYLNLRGAVDAARYLELWQLTDRLADLSADNKMKTVLRESAELARLAKLDMAEQAEFEDLAVTWHGGTQGHTVDAVMTKTQRGKQLYEADAGNGVALPEPAVSNPTLAAEWRLRRGDDARDVEAADWLQSEESSTEALARLEDFGDWSWLGALRAPTAVGSAASDLVRESATPRIDPSALVAGRIALGEMQIQSDQPSEALTGAATLHIAAGSTGDQIVEALRTLADDSDALELAVESYDDRTTEVRLSFGTSLDEAFESGDSRSEIERFALESSASTTRKIAELLPGLTGPAKLPATRNLVGTLADQGALSIRRSDHDNWLGFQLMTSGADESDIPKIKKVDYKPRQPTTRCLDRIAARNVKLYGEALQASQPDMFLRDRLTADSGRLQNAIASCDSGGQAESDRAAWAGDYLKAWRALVEYRTRSDQAFKRLLELCEDGHEWACGPEQGEWPWVAAAR